MIRTAACALAALHACSVAADAQVLLTSRDGDKANDRLGAWIRGAGDVNNDGRPDWIVGAPEDGNIISPGRGFARVYSGATGAVLHTLLGVSNGDRFGTSVDQAGDVNLDGFADVVVGAPNVSSLGNNRGRVTIHSGATGAALFTFDGAVNNDRLGTIVVGVGDVNGDGRPDVLSASRDASGGGTQRGVVRVFSGLTGGILHDLAGGGNGQRLGLSAAAIGDVTGDGRADFVVSTLTAGVRVYNGSTGGIAYTVPSPSPDDLFGASVGSIGDLTGDGVRDLLVGATQDANIFNQGPGYVRIYNGATGAFVRTLPGSSVGDRFGIAVGDAGDLNGDGKPEVLVGADQFNNGGPGFVRVFDGNTGAVLHTFIGLSNNDRFGASVAGLGNLNGTGGLEIGIAAPERSQPFLLGGRAEIWTADFGGACATPYAFCAAANNSTGVPALISHTGTVSISANNFGLLCTGLPPNTSALFYFGQTEIQQPFGNGFRCVGGSVFRLGIQQASPGGTIARNLDFPTAPGALGPGSTAKFQCWYRNPAAGGAGFNLSNGLSATFCN
ncbi:MAG: FG-GAP repeat protein [Planctomycetes bacterium]|nr:FG-GAP repeat protein [Planctomycetota bacterium]